MKNPMHAYARADFLQARLGLTPQIGLKVAAIITFAGAIEHFLERALWRVRGINPRGIKPDTDAKMISDLIAMLARYGEGLEADKHRNFLENWCAAARSGFVIRNNIAHGVPMTMSDTLAYMRNPRWEGEIRKRDFGDFWADPNTLDMVSDAMAVLFRSIALLSKDDATLEDVVNETAARALRRARSVLGEFASQTYNPSYEKY